GLLSSARYDWDAELGKLLKDESHQIAVVMFGANDAQSVRDSAGKWQPVGSEAWRDAYGKRVEAFVKKLRDANVAIYWVGLPIMRSPAQSEDATAMNDVFREKAFINGAKFIETWNGFTDEQGRFSAYGPDMTGQAKRLRSDDGVHFTMRGYLKLAHFVEKELRKDLTVAKQERNIPLAGNEEEQAKVLGRFVAPETPAPAPTPQAQQPEIAAAAKEEETEELDSYTGDADDGQANNVGDVNLVRPEIADNALQAADILSSRPEISTTEPEVITSELPSGLTAVATISAVTDLSLTSSRPRLPLSQRPYYKVLIKGEQVEPKSGRADDFAWPSG
ncbi:MAG: SGNH/GDSL hydrolase family protein, partial [Methyloceanibacter sp.]